MNIKIILIGMKGCGKSTVANQLSKRLGITSIELDQEIEKIYNTQNGEELACREIFINKGNDYFRQLENNVLKNLLLQPFKKSFILSCGGGTPLLPENRHILTKLGKVVFLDTDEKVLLQRILRDGIPAFFTDRNNPRKSLKELLKVRRPVYKEIADLTIRIKNEDPQEIADMILKRI